MPNINPNSRFLGRGEETLLFMTLLFFNFLCRVKRTLAGVQIIPVMMKHSLQHLLGLYQ